MDRDRAALGVAFPRTHHILSLEFGDRKDFDDPRQEWRRLFSELLGTFALVLVAAGGGILHAKGQISLAAAVVAPGLMVMAIILFMGAVSGAHLNPGVSLAFALRGDFPWKRVPGYIVIQLIGATLAALFLRWVFGNVEHLGATLPGPGYKNWQALLMEIVLTALLVSVILGTASAAQNVGAIAALGVGGYIALAGLWSAPVSGTSMNPARSFGPALVSGDWSSYWVYVAGPIAGALIAVGFAYVLRGRGGDVISRAAGSGVLDEGALTAKAKLSQDIEQGKAVPPGITGTGEDAAALGVMEIRPTAKGTKAGYGYENKEHWEERVTLNLVDDALIGGVIDRKFEGYDLVGQWSSYGWNVLPLADGHDYNQIGSVLKMAEDWDPADTGGLKIDKDEAGRMVAEDDSDYLLASQSMIGLDQFTDLREVIDALAHDTDVADILGEHVANQCVTEEALEGMSAFLDKRKPRWAP
jgi:aquaporin Z